VQRVGSVVDGELVLRAVQRELSFRDAIAIPPDQRAEVGTALDVIIELVVTEHDVGVLALAIGGGQVRDDAAIGRDLCFHAMGVSQCV
jgi:hypothetical protein